MSESRRQTRSVYLVYLIGMSVSTLALFGGVQYCIVNGWTGTGVTMAGICGGSSFLFCRLHLCSVSGEQVKRSFLALAALSCLSFLTSIQHTGSMFGFWGKDNPTISWDDVAMYLAFAMAIITWAFVIRNRARTEEDCSCLNRNSG